MSEVIPLVTVLLAGLATLFAAAALLASLRSRFGRAELSELVARSVRDEGERLRQSTADHAQAGRVEMADALSRFQDSNLRMHAEFGDKLSTRVDQFAARLDTAVQNVNEKVAAISGKLDLDMAKMGAEAAENRDRLRQTIEAKLDDATAKQNRSSADFRDSVGGSFETFRSGIHDVLGQMSSQQNERLEATNTALTRLIEKHERSQESLRQTVEGRLDTLRADNAAKLEEMRNTVDEKLKTTLDTRLGESFNRVVEQLERVHKGIGEMQSLATNVGDLKSVLTNVKVRGTFGEVQLALLLQEFLTPDQYVKDAQIKDGSGERVEFAIKMPGRSDGAEVLVPIDAKFPRDDYERLLAASDSGDTKLVTTFRKALESRIKGCAKDIRDKYICPPRTTDFGILFLPTEGLYAEVLRQPGLFEHLHRECRVILAGPTTLAAILNAYQMGFKTLAIEQRSSEVWQVLGAVRTEFGKYNKVVADIERQLGTAANSVSRLGQRTRVMTRTLKSVEELPDAATAERLLGIAEGDGDPVEDELDEHLGGDDPPNHIRVVEHLTS